MKTLLAKTESVKTFSYTSKKVSIGIANETENRLLKSGKDISCKSKDLHGEF